MQSFFISHKATLFREWRTSRAWLVGLGILSIIGPLRELFVAIYQMSQGYSINRWVFWEVLLPELYRNSQGFSQGFPPTSAFYTSSDPAISGTWVLTAIVIGIIPWATDREFEGFFAAMTAPISRTELAVTKCSFGLGVVLCIQLLRGVIDFSLNAWGGAPVSWHLLAVWWITNTLCMLSACATAFLVASVVTSWLPAVLFAGTILSLPFILASFLDKVAGYHLVFQYEFSRRVSRTPPDPFGWLRALSPLKWTGGGSASGGDPVQYTVYTGQHYLFMVGYVWIFFACWACVAVWWAIRLFNSVPMENISLFFVYPKTWKILIGTVSALIGYLIALHVGLVAAHGGGLLIAVIVFSLLVYGALVYGFHRWSHRE